MNLPTSDDLAAAKDEGDLVEYLLATAGLSRKRASRPAAIPGPDLAAAARPITSPLHRPGAWPFGLGPPGPTTCHPDCDCAIQPRPPEGSTT